MVARDPRRGALAFGPAVVQRLLAVRPPFLMVDRVDAVTFEPRPRALASRLLSANDPVFAAHFPQLAVLPGALLTEGLGQVSGVLMALVMLRRGYESRGLDPEALGAALRNLDRGFRLDPGYRPDTDGELAEALDPTRAPRVGFLASSQMKFIKPVFPGEVLGYELEHTRELDALWHFTTRATVGSTLVAEGTIVNALVEVPRLVR